ncbi:hypothetical protein ACU4GD_00355 [Cupriavidus basilensis]
MDMGRIHPHAFGSHGLAAGMALNVMQDYPGHTSIATTTLYSTADRDRRLQDAEKFYRVEPEAGTGIRLPDAA